MIGKTISHYKIIEKLGEGGMGVVYKAHDLKLDRLVALKFLPKHLTSDATEKERFIHEARAASALNHPNITTIHEIDEFEGQIFIVMEFCEGKTLRQIVESETLPIKKVLEVATQVCEGLALAHEKGIVHRDIKSDNIMLTARGQVKIMDFGLAKLRGRGEAQTGSTLGTAAYLSPEQARGEEVDQRSDIFSFGVVLYELLAKRLPFQGEHQAALTYAIIYEEPQPLTRFNNQVSAKLEDMVFKALAKDREERYQHIDDLLADLRREKKNVEYVKVPHVPSAPAPPAPSKKNLWKYLVPTSAVVVLALVIFILKPFKFEVGPEQKAVAAENSLAVMYFENIPDPEDKDHTGEMLSNLLITSLSQARGLEVISRERLYDIQKEMGQADARTITPSLASQIAKRAGVKTMLLGSILQKQPALAVTSRLIDVSSGKIVSSQRVTGFSTDQIFPLVDSLAGQVRRDLAVTPAPAAEAKSVAEVTTNSPEAYRSYLEGVELQDKFYFVEAKAALKKATELDSNFAMAYFQLVTVEDNSELQRKALQKAWQLRNKAAEKERLQIQAAYVGGIDNNPAKAAEFLEELVRKYPHEQSAYIQLARTYVGLGLYEKSLQTQLTGLQTDSSDKNLWNLLAYANAGLNRKAEALEAVNHYLKLAPGEPNPYDSKAEIYFVFGEVDSALYWYQKAISLRADFQSIEKLGHNALLRQDYATAEKCYQQFGSTSDKSQKAQAEDDLLLIPLHRGQLQQVRKQVLNNLQTHLAQKLQNQIIGDYFALAGLSDKAGDYATMVEYAQKASAELKKNPSDKIYGRDLLAWAYAKNGNAQMASKLLSELKKDVPEKSTAAQAQAAYTAALLAYEDGKYDLAVTQFQKAFQPLLPNHAPQFHYAVCLLKSGHISEAIAELQRVTWWSPISLPIISLFILPTSGYWPLASVKAHFWLGVAYEQQGEKEKAVKEYEKFLEIWKDADPDIKELSDAKERLAKLKTKA